MRLAAMCTCGHRHKAKKHGDDSRRDIMHLLNGNLGGIVMVLDNIEPKKVFRYFEEICNIPHGSGNTGKISEYCCEFAKDRGLKYIQDEKGNVIIFKEGTFDGKNAKPVILQGHMDMVCEKEKDCNKNMETEGLDLEVNGDFIEARGTTLGGDDGIAVAYCLAILDSEDIVHPPLEVVFTVDEEIGMLGAAALDYSKLKGRTMINLDSEEEGNLLVSCAGGVTATCHIAVDKESAAGEGAVITVKGLLGGHSGAEIDKGRANSNQIMGRVLYELSGVADYELVSVNGGLKDNAIPRETKAEIIIAKDELEKIKNKIECCNSELKNEYKNTDKDIEIEITFSGETTKDVFTNQVKDNVITALFILPGGIQKMSSDIKGLVQTSLNMGILKTSEDEVTMSYSVRSSIGTEKRELVEKLTCIMKAVGGRVTCEGEYPAWEYKKESELRNLMSEIYREQTGREAVVQAMHAGVECGMFAGNLEGLDCVSIGPDIFDIHTTGERLPISSAVRTWEFLLMTLKKLS